jgi:hypothetical protein
MPRRHPLERTASVAERLSSVACDVGVAGRSVEAAVRVMEWISVDPW